MSIDFQRLYRSERDALLAYLARRTADPELALELLAETFAQAVASQRRFRGDSEAAWLYGIAKHQHRACSASAAATPRTSCARPLTRAGSWTRARRR